MGTTRARALFLFLLSAGLLCAASYSREAQCVQDCEKKGSEEGEKQHPYVFEPSSFRCLLGSCEQQGCIRALPPFHEPLLHDLRSYGVTFLEINPGYFILPSYEDAHTIGYVTQGEGVVTFYQKGEKQSFILREGDVLVAPAVSFMHAANTDSRRKLVIVMLVHTISVPGVDQVFFANSLLSGLSKRIQRAAFKTSEDRLERLLARQGFMVRGTEQQMGELRRHATEGGQQSPHRSLDESHGPYKLLQQPPSIANRYGRRYEVDASSFTDLAEHDVRVSLINITAGSMSAPFFNTRSVKIAVVLDGEGEVEIVCPRGGDSEQGHGDTVHARLSRGAAFVVPVGHPVLAVASRSSNLQIVCFDIHAEKNERVYLAGANSVLKKMDRVAKELAFSLQSEREVDEVLNAQQDAGFLQGPEHSEKEGEMAVEALLGMLAAGL